MKSRDELLAPKPADHRWTAWDKGNICTAVADGVITTAELETAHGISPEEFDSWRTLYLQGHFAKIMEKQGRKGRAA